MMLTFQQIRILELKLIEPTATQPTTSACSTDIAAEFMIVSVIINLCSAVQQL